MAMQRPVMNPMFMDEDEATPAGKRRRRLRLDWIWKIVKKIASILFAEVISLRGHAQLRIEDGTFVQRLIRSILYRLAFVPIVLVLFVIVLVFAATHPPHFPPELDPMAQGVFYTPVSFTSDDGLPLEGWLVPAMDAHQVVSEKEAIFGKRQPAVVLVHDFGASRQQVLPLVKPLHDAGMVVLVVGLRGTGADRGAAQTFGLKESDDVLAAVYMLRRRTFVDGAYISVVGVGSGANAAVLAAERDPHIASVVLNRPMDGFDAAFMNRVGKDRTWLNMLLPMCKWTFEIMYHVDADGLSMARLDKAMDARPVLVYSDAGSSMAPLDPTRVAAITEFLTRKGVAPGHAVAATE